MAAKATFFRRLGFEGRVERLEKALLDLVCRYDVSETVPTPFGVKYIVDGEIEATKGTALVRTVWIIEAGVTFPRFVTAYPRG